MAGIPRVLRDRNLYQVKLSGRAIHYILKFLESSAVKSESYYELLECARLAEHIRAQMGGISPARDVELDSIR